MHLLHYIYIIYSNIRDKYFIVYTYFKMQILL